MKLKIKNLYICKEVLFKVQKKQSLNQKNPKNKNNNKNKKKILK